MVEWRDHDRSRGEQSFTEGAAGVGVGVPAVLLQAPGGLGEAFCSVGVGLLITAFLWVGSVYLAYLSLGDFLNAAAASNSRSGDQHARREHMKDGGVKIVGATVFGGLPTILAGLGFSLLTCVDTANIFDGGTAALIALA